MNAETASPILAPPLITFDRVSRHFASLDPDLPLARGYARVMADGRLVQSVAAAQAAGAVTLPDASAQARWPEATCLFAAVYDGMAPPSASVALHAALQGSSLVWFATGHWPNLAFQSNGAFQEAALAFLRGAALPPKLRRLSSEARQAIELWDAPPPPSAKPICLSECLLL